MEKILVCRRAHPDHHQRQRQDPQCAAENCPEKETVFWNFIFSHEMIPQWEWWKTCNLAISFFLILVEGNGLLDRSWCHQTWSTTSSVVAWVWPLFKFLVRLTMTQPSGRVGRSFCWVTPKSPTILITYVLPKLGRVVWLGYSFESWDLLFYGTWTSTMISNYWIDHVKYTRSRSLNPLNKVV